MSGNDLVKEIEEALQDEDMEMLRILIDGETDHSIKSIKERISSALREKLDAFLQGHKELIEKEKANDSIRRINAQSDPSDEDSNENAVEAEIKKRAKATKLEQKFGYAFYGQVKCLMVAYGDPNPSEQAVKMMHSQLETLKFELLKSLSSEYSKPSKMKHYLSEIFPQEFQSYYAFKKVYKSATDQKAKQDPNGSEDSELLSDESEGCIDHMVATGKDEKEYFLSVTLGMSVAEYEKYAQSRSVNFLQNKKIPANVKKLLKFLDPDAKFSPSTFDIELMSFLLCRIVRRVVFRVARSRSEGRLLKLRSPITVEEIKEEGNEIIEEYQTASSAYFSSPAQEALLVFTEEFKGENYRDIFPKGVIKDPKHPCDPLEIWRDNKIYQKMWTERVQAEKEVEQRYQQIQAGEYEPTFEYSRFICKHYHRYQEMGKPFLWRKYFLQESPDEQVGRAPRKQGKLESLKR